jgi:hypothetical protein
MATIIGRLEIRYAKTLCFTLSLVLCASLVLKAQDEPPLAVQIRQTIKDKEPNWQYIAAIDNVPVRPSEKRILVGLWERKQQDGQSEIITISAYEIESSAEAQKWLSPLSKGQVAAGWRVYKYSIGDEGYMAKYQNERQFEIHFRKRNVLVKMSGQDLKVVERFAKYVVARVAPSNNSFNLTPR